MTLGHVLSGCDGQRRRLGLPDIVVDCQRLEGGERADQTVDVVALDEFLRLRARGCRNAGRVGHDQFDFSTGKLVVPVLQVHDERAFHIDAARSQWSGLHGQKPHANRAGSLCRGPCAGEAG